MVGRVATCGNISDIDDGTKRILEAVSDVVQSWSNVLILTSSSEVVTKKSAWMLSPAPVQK